MRRLPMNIVILSMGALGLALSQSAPAQDRMPLGATFDGLLQMSQMKCAESGDRQAEELEKQGKKAEAYTMRSARKTICVCMPAKIRQLKTTLPPEKLAEMLTEDEIKTTYMMKIMGSCAGEMMIDSFSGDCGARFGATTKLPPKYCSCMQNAFRKFSDVELAQLGLDNAEWTPRAAEAKKSGAPEPEMTPLLKRMKAVDTACRGD